MYWPSPCPFAVGSSQYSVRFFSMWRPIKRSRPSHRSISPTVVGCQRRTCGWSGPYSVIFRVARAFVAFVNACSDSWPRNFMKRSTGSFSTQLHSRSWKTTLSGGLYLSCLWWTKSCTVDWPVAAPAAFRPISLVFCRFFEGQKRELNSAALFQLYLRVTMYSEGMVVMKSYEQERWVLEYVFVVVRQGFSQPTYPRMG